MAATPLTIGAAKEVPLLYSNSFPLKLKGATPEIVKSSIKTPSP